jgi:uncharacterized membrane protein YdjX (TVP38/TMEM64 family)/Fe-S oxidoreductase
MNLVPGGQHPRLSELLDEISQGCRECGACVADCSFLQLYGTPRAIALGSGTADPKLQAEPFECSLCAHCKSSCLFGVDPRALFQEMRREAVRRGTAPFPEHRRLLGYERMGTSRWLTWYGLPAGCDTVFFPGCALPGSRPAATWEVFGRLREAVPSLGLVLDCCTKPSHDLGREGFFSAMFDELKSYLISKGVRRVLVACPNCWRVFTEHAAELSVTTVYEMLPPLEDPGLAGHGEVTVHDPCAMRFAEAAQGAVRSLVASAGLAVVDMPHARAQTLCCGEGGAAGALAPAFAASWGEQLSAEAAGRPVVTYCAGCVQHLSAQVSVVHVLDVLSEPSTAMAGKAPASRGFVTYWNRLRLKARFKREVHATVTRERAFSPERRAGAWLKPLALVLLLVAVLSAVRGTGLGAYIEQERLRALIAGFGPWAPALYLLLYTVAPALFLPGLPITLVGGILFGPYWGVVYAITGATAGACVAFLVSRYSARRWIERRLVGSRWRKLDADVACHGWKVVAFTRLVPLFPFNLLNYALGLTKIGFLPFAVTTFVCMLPACITFIVFSSSILDLLRGKLSSAHLAGILLIAAASPLPLLVRKLAARRPAGTTLRPGPTHVPEHGAPNPVPSPTHGSPRRRSL